MSWTIHHGDWIERLKEMPAESVHCVVTSPPYWGLRDYGAAGQLGLEKTPEEYIAKMVEGFREVRRVLRTDGTLWLNLGDCYATGAGKVGECPGGGEQGERWKGNDHKGRGTPKRADGTGGAVYYGPMQQPNRMPISGLKPKDLVMMPARVAITLQSDGWWLRQDIIWSKPNPMPESVQDRCTKAHEYIFLLTKSERYFYDAEAIKEPCLNPEDDQRRIRKATLEGKSTPTAVRNGIRRRPSVKRGGFNGKTNTLEGREAFRAVTEYRNKRSVWNVATSPFPEAHFATFPPKLVEPCIKAGCPEGGTVLDPFAGAGTTGLVATRLGRNFIGIELKAEYVEMARRRIVGDAPLFNRQEAGA